MNNKECFVIMMNDTIRAVFIGSKKNAEALKNKLKDDYFRKHDSTNLTIWRAERASLVEEGDALA